MNVAAPDDSLATGGRADRLITDQRCAHALQPVPFRDQPLVWLELCLNPRETPLDLRHHVTVMPIATVLRNRILIAIRRDVIVMPVVTVPRNRALFVARSIKSLLVVRAARLIAIAGCEFPDEVSVNIEHMFDITANPGRLNGLPRCDQTRRVAGTTTLVYSRPVTGHARLATGSALLIAALVGFCAAAATFWVSSSVFDGGTDSGNQIAAISVGTSVGLLLTWYFTRRGMGILHAVLVILIAWGGGFVMLFALYLGLLYWGCRDGGCI